MASGITQLKKWCLHMCERRRAKKDAIICDESAGESTNSAEDSTSRNNGSPAPSLFDKRRKEYVSYFNPGEY